MDALWFSDFSAFTNYFSLNYFTTWGYSRSWDLLPGDPPAPSSVLLARSRLVRERREGVGTLTRWPTPYLLPLPHPLDLDRTCLERTWTECTPPHLPFPLLPGKTWTGPAWTGPGQDIPYPTSSPCEQKDRHVWKSYLPIRTNVRGR